MTTCYRCGAEIQMFVEGLPICGTCSKILSQKTKPELHDTQSKLPCKKRHVAVDGLPRCRSRFRATLA
jgi:hypothetical protein